MFVAMSMSPRPLFWSPVGTGCSPASEEQHAVPTGLGRETGKRSRCYKHPVPLGLKGKRGNILVATNIPSLWDSRGGTLFFGQPLKLLSLFQPLSICNFH